MNTKSLAVLALASFILGCGNTLVNAEVENGKVPPQQTVKMKAKHVLTQTTAYYAGNPAQARAADGSLKAGVAVNVIEDAGSYTLVETKEGIRGYISSDAIEVINPK